MDKRVRIEGSSESQWVQVIRKFGHNTDVEFEIGTVLAPPPEISVRLDRDDIILDKQDLVVAESLLEHTRSMTIGDIRQSVTMHSPLMIGDRVIIAAMDEKQRYFLLDKRAVM